MFRFYLFFCLFFFSISSVCSAAAESSDLLKEIAFLKQRLEVLEKRLHDQEKIVQVHREETHKKEQEIDERLISLKEEYTSQDYVKIPEDEENKFYVGGYVQHDSGWFFDDKSGRDYGSTIRNMRLGVSGVAFKDWVYKLENNFAENKSKINSAFIGYRGFDHLLIRAGQFAQASGLEGSTSNRDRVFIESNPVSDAFSPDVNLGTAFTYSQPRWTVSGGLASKDAIGGTEDQRYGWTGRITGLPYDDGKHILHLGVSGSIRESADGTKIRYTARPETKVLKDFLDTGNLSNVKDIRLAIAELAYLNGPFGIRSEYAHNQLVRPSMQNLRFYGAYVEAFYTLTGEGRSYDRNIGGIGGLKPRVNFDWKKGEWGAWEIATHYNVLDLNDKDIKGGRMQNFGTALNWYPNQYIRMMLDYTKVNTDRNAVFPDNDPHILMLRLQAGF